MQITDTVTSGTVDADLSGDCSTAHVPGGGDAIGDGFLYRGALIPALQGKYIFTDIATGRIWYADYAEMLAADDGNPKTMATMHEVTVRWKGQTYDSMLPIVDKIYHERGGRNPVLNGHNVMSGNGRADARLAMDASGELFIYTKNDGMIRAITGRVVR